jgi:hypothetical protein
MQSDFEIIEKEIGTVVEIEEKAPTWRMPTVMGRDFHKLIDYVDAQHSELVDVPYSHYVDIQWDKQLKKGALGSILDMFFKRWHFFVGMPISNRLTAQGNIKPAMLDKRKYVKGVHKGSYESMGDTYLRMVDWTKKQGLTPAPESLEFYMNDPTYAKQEELETVVLVPVSSEKS